MPTIKSERGRDDAQRDTKRPISLRAELTILIVVSSVLAFVLAWIATMLGLNGWIALPIAIAATLVFTYVTSRHLPRPLAQMIDAAQAMAEGDYSACTSRRTAVTKWANSPTRSTSWRMNSNMPTRCGAT